MHTIKAIGLDTAKSVFQVHGVDAEGQVVVRRQLKRRYVPRALRASPALDPNFRLDLGPAIGSKLIELVGYRFEMLGFPSH